MGLAVLFAGAFVDKRAASVLAALNTILLIGTQLMIAPGSDPRPSALVFWWLMALTIWLYEDTLQEALRRSWAEVLERKQAEETLRASEDKFKYVFDNSTVGKSITLISGEINTNQALCDMLGYTLAEFKSKKWQEITHPDDIELTQREIDQLLSGKRDAARFVKRFIHKDGSVVWVDLSSSIRRAADGQPLYLMTSVIDITERKQTEHALGERMKELQAFYGMAEIAEKEGITLDKLYQELANILRGVLHLLAPLAPRGQRLPIETSFSRLD
jgi:PAS domain S-box-containing protein